MISIPKRHTDPTHKRVLAAWYSSEEAKRQLGYLCRTLSEVRDGRVELLGTEKRPLLVMANQASVPVEPGEVEFGLEEARAKWATITFAVMAYGTRFIIKDTNDTPLVAIFRHDENRHPAVNYQRSASPDAERIASALEALGREVRKLPSQLALNFIKILPKFVGPLKLPPETTGALELLPETVRQLSNHTENIGKSADLIARRFRDYWRLEQGYPVNPPH